MHKKAWLFKLTFSGRKKGVKGRLGKGHMAKLAANRRRGAKYENMLKGAPAKTWSARMPAYCYTELCADPGMKGGGPIGQGDTGTVHRRM